MYIFCVSKCDTGLQEERFLALCRKTLKSAKYLRRNSAFAPKSANEVAYKTLGRPKLVYAAPIWSTYL